MSVTRYEPYANPRGRGPEMGIIPDGRYMLHADHAAEVERLEQRLLDQHHELAGLHEHNAILAERVRVLEEALRNIVAHEVDYMTRNHLGDPEKQSYIIQARAALAQPQQKEGE